MKNTEMRTNNIETINTMIDLDTYTVLAICHWDEKVGKLVNLEEELVEATKMAERAILKYNRYLDFVDKSSCSYSKAEMTEKDIENYKNGVINSIDHAFKKIAWLNKTAKNLTGCYFLNEKISMEDTEKKLFVCMAFVQAPVLIALEEDDERQEMEKDMDACITEWHSYQEK